MSSAGQQLVAGRIPGERIGITIEDSDSSTFTAETTVLSLTFPTIIGRTYEVWTWLTLASSVDNDDVCARIREDNTSGTVLQEANWELVADLQGTRGQPTILVCDYVADATENKTIIVTGERAAGTGNIRREASATKPSRLWANYASG